MGFRMAAGVLLVTSIAFGAWQAKPQRADGDWPSFGRDPGARRYSPLTQITTQNVGVAGRRPGPSTPAANDLQVTPIVIDGLMYFTGGSTVFALEPETGKTGLEVRREGPVSRRGVAYWPGERCDSRRDCFPAPATAGMVALDARTGAVVAGVRRARLRRSEGERARRRRRAASC